MEDSSVFELERYGHGIFGVREFCQLLLRESGRERRVFGRAQLTALMLHNGIALPGAAHLAATSTLHRRKGVQDLLQLFRLLEQEGVTAEKYEAVAATSNELVPQKLAEAYKRYQQLLMQHNATSWDGMVMEVAEMCGLHDTSALGEEVTFAKEFSRMMLKEYTDVVIEDVERITPAMATLVGHLCGQPSVRSSASFSRRLTDENECLRTHLLEQQLLKTAACTGSERSVTRLSAQSDVTEAEKRAQMQTFAEQILTKSATATFSTRALCPVPLECWSSETFEAEEKKIGTFLTQKFKIDDNVQVTVLCPSYADAHRIMLAFKKLRLPVHFADDQFAVRTKGASVHLFDEPGVNAVYSLLCALCFPSDSRHLYNVLRSDYVAFPAELLSCLMEKEHRGHMDLFAVVEAFVESKGSSLGTSYAFKEVGLSEQKALALESGLKKAKLFVNLIKRLRAECHQLSAVEIVHCFLKESGRLTTLVDPSSLAQERESLTLADFLRELETVQNIVKSDQVTFVAPYLQELRETNLTSSATSEEVPDVTSTKFTTSNGNVRVLPLTKHALESLAASAAKDNDNPHVLVLMSMRDSKFPGRMKRLTLPLPYELLSEPYPVQTRSEHLRQCEKLAYEALMLAEYKEIVLSFAELAPFSYKREILSRTFQSIWHEREQSGITVNESRGRTRLNETTSSPKLAMALHSTLNKVPQKDNANASSYVWLSKAVKAMRELANRINFSDLAAKTFSSTNSNEDNATCSHQQQNEVASSEKEASSHADSYCLRTPAPKSVPYEPSHLSYSQISEYLRCPHRYYLSRVMKLNGDVSPSMMFGRALHEGVAAFAKSLTVDQQCAKVTEETKTLATVAAKEAFVHSWLGNGYGLVTSEEHASFLLEQGLMALGDFIETHNNDLHLEQIVHVEQEFSIYIPEANVELRGVWDRIDLVSNPGDGSSSFVIQEFKSNMSGAQRNMQKLAADSLQLKLYMYAFRRLYGEPPYGAKLQQIGGNYSDKPVDFKSRRTQHSKMGNVENGFVLFTEKVEQESIEAIVKVASSLRKGLFDPKPAFAECAFCPYAGSLFESLIML